MSVAAPQPRIARTKAGYVHKTVRWQLGLRDHAPLAFNHGLDYPEALALAKAIRDGLADAGLSTQPLWEEGQHRRYDWDRLVDSFKSRGLVPPIVTEDMIG